MRKIALCIFVMICAGCQQEIQELPVDIWIDNQFNEREEEALVNAMNHWEKATAVHIFNYKGRRVDNVFTNDDYNDDYHTIYKATVVTQDIIDTENAIVEEYGYRPSAWGSLDDIVYLQVRWNLDPDYLDPNSGVEHYDEFWEFLYWVLEMTITHELGHFLGMDHNDEESIMNPNRDWPYALPIFVPEYDVNVFCELYDEC